MSPPPGWPTTIRIASAYYSPAISLTWVPDDGRYWRDPNAGQFDPDQVLLQPAYPGDSGGLNNLGYTDLLPANPSGHAGEFGGGTFEWAQTESGIEEYDPSAYSSGASATQEEDEAFFDIAGMTFPDSPGMPGYVAPRYFGHHTGNHPGTSEDNMTAAKGFKIEEGFTHANGFTEANGFTKANGF